MSLQDDIFDIQDALEGKPEAATFDRLYKRFARIELELEETQRELHDIKQATRIIKQLFEDI